MWLMQEAKQDKDTSAQNLSRIQKDRITSEGVGRCQWVCIGFFLPTLKACECQLKLGDLNGIHLEALTS